MLGLPNGVPDENGEHLMSNDTPLVFSPQTESPGRSVPEDGKLFNLAEQSFSSARGYDSTFVFLTSGGQPFQTAHHFVHPSASVIYVNRTVGVGVASSSELLSLPSVSRVV
jgi:hypothetical protein